MNSKKESLWSKVSTFLVFAGPATFAFLAVVIVPFLYGVYLTFTSWDGVSSNKPFVGLKNYAAVVADSSFWQSLGLTLLYVVVSVILVNVIGFLLALLVTGKIKGKNFFRAGFFTPNLIGGIILGYIWQFIFEIVFSQLIFNKDGIINIPFFCNMLQDRYKAMIALAILVTWQMAGYMMLIYTTGLNNIPTDLSEAAAIDGANVFQRFRYITIPMLMPSFTIVFFLTLSKCFMLLDPNVALTDGNFNTRLLAMQILRTTKDTNPPDYGLAQAQAVIFFLLIAAVTLTQVVVTKKKEVEM